MAESRDENDPRDQLRAMNKQLREEFEQSQRGDTGGQEHARAEDRAGVPAREEEGGARRAERSARGQGDARAPRTPSGDGASAGAQAAGGPAGEG